MYTNSHLDKSPVSCVHCCPSEFWAQSQVLDQTSEVPPAPIRLTSHKGNLLPDLLSVTWQKNGQTIYRRAWQASMYHIKVFKSNVMIPEKSLSVTEAQFHISNVVDIHWTLNNVHSLSASTEPHLLYWIVFKPLRLSHPSSGGVCPTSLHLQELDCQQTYLNSFWSQGILEFCTSAL